MRPMTHLPAIVPPGSSIRLRLHLVQIFPSIVCSPEKEKGGAPSEKQPVSEQLLQFAEAGALVLIFPSALLYFFQAAINHL
jgi:hypothetical protein